MVVRRMKASERAFPELKGEWLYEDYHLKCMVAKEGNVAYNTIKDDKKKAAWEINELMRATEALPSVHAKVKLVARNWIKGCYDTKDTSGAVTDTDWKGYLKDIWSAIKEIMMVTEAEKRKDLGHHFRDLATANSKRNWERNLVDLVTVVEKLQMDNADLGNMISDQDVCFYILEALPDDVARNIRLFANEKTKKSEDLIKLLKLQISTVGPDVLTGHKTVKLEANWTGSIGIPPRVTPKECSRCGNTSKHKEGKCPAMGMTCNKCGKPNHFSNVCRGGKSEDENAQHGSQQGPRSPNVFKGKCNKCGAFGHKRSDCIANQNSKFTVTAEQGEENCLDIPRRFCFKTENKIGNSSVDRNKQM